MHSALNRDLQLPGGGAWVTTVSLVGYFFGSRWDTLVKVIGQVNLIIAIIVLAVLVFVWHRYRERMTD